MNEPTDPTKVIGIDGPSAGGKGALSSVLAFRLGMPVLDSGSIYRMMTFMILHDKIDPLDSNRVTAFLEKGFARMRMHGGLLELDGQPLGDLLRTPEIDMAVDTVAKIPRVRRLILPLQRAQASGHGLIAEGRDICSVIFPEARLKVFLTAPLEKRAERRFAQYQAKGQGKSLQEIQEELARRDYEDAHREDSPLVCVEGSLVIDSGKLTVAAEADIVVDAWEKKTAEIINQRLHCEAI